MQLERRPTGAPKPKVTIRPDYGSSWIASPNKKIYFISFTNSKF